MLSLIFNCLFVVRGHPSTGDRSHQINTTHQLCSVGSSLPSGFVGNGRHRIARLRSHTLSCCRPLFSCYGRVEMGVASEQGLLSLGLQLDTMLEAQAETLTQAPLFLSCLLPANYYIAVTVHACGLGSLSHHHSNCCHIPKIPCGDLNMFLLTLPNNLTRWFPHPLNGQQQRL